MNHHQNINPNFNKKAFANYTLEECINGLISGDTKILAFLISKAESHQTEDQQFISQILNSSKINPDTRVLAISGSPGVGKSTYINSFGNHLISLDKRLAVLPVDPTSHISKGSILGDKTRMSDLSLNENCFIKPTSSGMALGGVASSSAIATAICKRSNFDYIIIETVGVGQSEFEVKYLTDMFILLLQAGGGDDLQGIKRGIMEMADLFVVSKADGSLEKVALDAKRKYQSAIGYFAPSEFNWTPKVCLHSSEANKGNIEIKQVVDSYFTHMGHASRLENLHAKNEASRFDAYATSLFISYIKRKPGLEDLLETLKSEIVDKKIIALQAIKKLEHFLYEA